MAANQESLLSSAYRFFKVNQGPIFFVLSMRPNANQETKGEIPVLCLPRPAMAAGPAEVRMTRLALRLRPEERGGED